MIQYAKSSEHQAIGSYFQKMKLLREADKKSYGW